MIRGFLVAASAAWLVGSAAQAATVERIRAHLVYEETGRLSADILSAPDFVAWDTIIGEGSAEEIANDLLVLVRVRGRGTGEAENIEEPLEIVARSGDRVLARRRFADSLLTAGDGTIWKSLFLPDIGCADEVTISATIGRSTRTATLNLDCGE